jgi:hypothetical protein
MEWPRCVHVGVLFLISHTANGVFFPGRSPARRERRQAQGHTHPDDGQDRQTQTDRRAETRKEFFWIPIMGIDAFGQCRFHCLDASGCACSDYCSNLDALPEAERAEMEARQNTLTCQRKSELVVFCKCGHPAWAHSSVAHQVLNPAEQVIGDAGRFGPWFDILSADLALLEEVGETLCQNLPSIGVAYALLDRSRVALLQRLREVGIGRLAARQQVANALGRTRRHATLEAARAAATVAAAEETDERLDTTGVTGMVTGLRGHAEGYS